MWVTCANRGVLVGQGQSFEEDAHGSGGLVVVVMARRACLLCWRDEE